MCLFAQCVLDPRVLLSAVLHVAMPVFERQLKEFPLPSGFHMEEFDVIAHARSTCQSFESLPIDLNVYSYNVVGLWYLVVTCIYIQKEADCIQTWFGNDPDSKAMYTIIKKSLQDYIEGQPPITSTSGLIQHILEQHMMLI